MLKSRLWMLALGMAFSDSLPATDSFTQSPSPSSAPKTITVQDLDDDDDEKNGIEFTLIEILEIQKDRLEKKA